MINQVDNAWVIGFGLAYILWLGRISFLAMHARTPIPRAPTTSAVLFSASITSYVLHFDTEAKRNWGDSGGLGYASVPLHKSAYHSLWSHTAELLIDGSELFCIKNRSIILVHAKNINFYKGTLKNCVKLRYLHPHTRQKWHTYPYQTLEHTILKTHKHRYSTSTVTTWRNTLNTDNNNRQWAARQPDRVSNIATYHTWSVFWR